MWSCYSSGECAEVKTIFILVDDCTFMITDPSLSPCEDLISASIMKPIIWVVALIIDRHPGDWPHAAGVGRVWNWGCPFQWGCFVILISDRSSLLFYARLLFLSTPLSLSPMPQWASPQQSLWITTLTILTQLYAVCISPLLISLVFSLLSNIGAYPHLKVSLIPRTSCFFSLWEETRHIWQIVWFQLDMTCALSWIWLRWPFSGKLVHVKNIRKFDLPSKTISKCPSSIVEA